MTTHMVSKCRGLRTWGWMWHFGRHFDAVILLDQNAVETLMHCQHSCSCVAQLCLSHHRKKEKLSVTMEALNPSQRTLLWPDLGRPTHEMVELDSSFWAHNARVVFSVFPGQWRRCGRTGVVYKRKSLFSVPQLYLASWHSSYSWSSCCSAPPPPCVRPCS